MNFNKTKKVKEKQKASYKDFNKTQKICFWICFAVILTGIIYVNTPEYKAQQAEKQAQLEAQEAEEAKANEKTPIEIRNENISNNKAALYLVSEDTISTLLKSPSTAKYGSWSAGWATDYENLLYATSYVDSQNSFGATLRADCQVGFKFDEYGENYKIVWISLEGTTYLDNRY